MKKKHKKKKTSKKAMSGIDLRNNINCSAYTKEELIEIQEEAYVRAMRRMELEKQQRVNDEYPQFDSKKDMIGYMLNVLFCPLFIRKKYTLRKGYSEGLIRLTSAGLVGLIGLLLWLSGVIFVILSLLGVLNNTWGRNEIFIAVVLAAYCLVFASCFIAAAREIDQEKDFQKICAYSFSLMAIVAVVISLISVIMN